MYRVFTPDIRDPVEAATKYKALGLTWRKGVHKDAKGVYGIKDLEYKGGYGTATKPVDGLVYQATVEREHLAETLEPYQTPSPLRIPVVIRAGVRLLISPATAEPQDFLFFGDDQGEPEMFRRNTDYGRAAWALLERHNKEEGEVVLQNDPLVVNLAKMALKHSYTLPLPVWDALQVLTLDDIDLISLAAMGASEDFTEAVGSNSATPACGTAKDA